MYTTPASLLDRLQHTDDQEAWSRMVDLYAPLIHYWANRAGLQDDDAVDLTQEVLLQLLRKLPSFKYDRNRTFRGWLRTVTLNKWREKQRRASLPIDHRETALSTTAVPDEVESFWESEYRQFLAARALRLMQSEFRETTWQACWETVVEGRPAAEVAEELGLSVGAVYAAKCRVLRRLRSEMDGLYD